MRQSAILIDNLSKQYRLGQKTERYRTFREAIVQSVTAPWRRKPAEGGDSLFWALCEVNLDIQPGETVGLIGRNGAGKSTLLKILSRITSPTSGSATIRGRLGSLLEVGAGFHTELTGRENTYLNAAILGMPKRDIDRQFDEIIAFADLEKFVDTPVKHYSSGMYMRLAFSVAAHLDPEILLVDEVLAVGDAAFQKKCLGKMGEVARQGRTVVFVSHNMGAIRALCQRAVWLEAGTPRADGPAQEVVGAYLKSLASSTFSHRNDKHGFTVVSVVLRDAGGHAADSFQIGDELVVDIAYQAEKPIDAANVIVSINGAYGIAFQANTLLDGHVPARLEGAGVIRVRFSCLPLLPQRYSVSLSVRTRDPREHILSSTEVASFNVEGSLRELGLIAERAPGLVPKSCSILIPYVWTLPGGDIRKVGETLPLGAFPAGQVLLQ